MHTRGREQSERWREKKWISTVWCVVRADEAPAAGVRVDDFIVIIIIAIQYI
jgi:hypothetical protein